MPYDGLVLAAVRRELEEKLTGSRIQRVQQPEKLTLVLQFRTPGMTYNPLLSAHPKQARVHLTGERLENPLSPPLFCSVCRKHLEGGRVKGLREGLLGAVSRARKRLEKRLEGCHGAAADGAKAQALRWLGEVLTANLYRLDGNAARVVLEDFHTGRSVEIARDPRPTGPVG